MEQPKAVGADLLLPAMALGFTLYFLYSIRDLAWEAKANGVIVGIVLLLLIAVQLIRMGIAVAQGRASLGLGDFLEPRDVILKRLGMLAITIALVIALPWTGLAIAVFAALAAGFTVMGVRGPARVLLTALAITVAVEALFIVALESSLPSGPVERLIERLRG
jgi:hypothetical protein